MTAEQKFGWVVLLPCLLRRAAGLLSAAGLNPQPLADLTSSTHVAMHAVNIEATSEAVMCFLQMRRLPLPLNPRHMKTQQKRLDKRVSSNSSSQLVLSQLLLEHAMLTQRIGYDPV